MGRRDVTWAGEVLGTAGAGLVDAGWAANEAVARIGRAGELRTAEVLDPLACSDGVTVLHDLRIPIPKFTANIDHAVVAGSAVLLIDSKAWKPGRYWSLAGSARRGLRRFPHAATKTPGLAFDSIGRFLANRGVDAEMLEPLVAVWPSSRTGRVSVSWLKMDRCRAVDAAALPRLVRRALPRRPADPALVAALVDLLTADRPAGPARGSVPASRSRGDALDFEGTTPHSPQPTGGLPAGVRFVADGDFGPAAPVLDSHPMGMFDGGDR